MAHDVNQSETEFAAQVRSALVSKISAERLDLWIPDSTEWRWNDDRLDLFYTDELRCQVACSTLSHEIEEVLHELGHASATVNFELRSADSKDSNSVPSASPLNSSADQSRSSDALDMQVSGKSVGSAVDPPLPTAPHFVSRQRKENRTSAGISAPSSTASSGSGGRAIKDRKPPNNQLQSVSQHQPIKTTEAENLSTLSVRGQGSSASIIGHRPTKSQPAKNADLADGREQRSPPSAAGLENWQCFIPGESNQLAWGAAQLVIETPGHMTPVFLHGPSGVGKSLLSAGITEYLRVMKRLRRVVHMSSEQFLNDFTEGLRNGGLPMFRRKYRDVEALILEDIQFFMGKKSSIAEVKNTLDNLLRLGKQVVFTADRSLNDLHPLGSELIGRIRGGLTVPVFPLDEATRFRILQREIEKAGIDIDGAVLEDIAAQVTGDGRVLSGIAKRLRATAAMEGRSLDRDRCWTAVRDLVQATRPIVRIMDIDRVVCDVFGLEPESLKSPSKIRRVSQPRMLAMFLARKYTPAAYKEIGQYFGRRRHSTVISAEKTVTSWLGENSDLDCGSGMKIREAIRHVESQLQVG